MKSTGEMMGIPCVTLIESKQWHGKTLTFREDGYFNMTKAAKEFGKRLDNFMASKETKEYVEALSLDLRDKDLIVVQRGSGLLPQVGTWAHPKLAVFFARWLDVRFAVACDVMIEDILHGHAEVAITDPEKSAVVNTPTSSSQNCIEVPSTENLESVVPEELEQSVKITDCVQAIRLGRTPGT